MYGHIFLEYMPIFKYNYACTICLYQTNKTIFMNIKICNIVIENKLYCINEDDPRYNCNDQYVHLNKIYEFKASEDLYSDLECVIKCYLEQISEEYCNDILDITTDDINIYALIVVKSEQGEKYYNIKYDIQFNELDLYYNKY